LNGASQNAIQLGIGQAQRTSGVCAEVDRPAGLLTGERNRASAGNQPLDVRIRRHDRHISAARRDRSAAAAT